MSSCKWCPTNSILCHWPKTAYKAIYCVVYVDSRRNQMDRKATRNDFLWMCTNWCDWNALSVPFRRSKELPGVEAVLLNRINCILSCLGTMAPFHQYQSVEHEMTCLRPGKHDRSVIHMASQRICWVKMKQCLLLIDRTYLWIDTNGTEVLLIEFSCKNVAVRWNTLECRGQIVFEVNSRGPVSCTWEMKGLSSWQRGNGLGQNIQFHKPGQIFDEAQLLITLQQIRNVSFECVAHLIRRQVTHPILYAQANTVRHRLHHLIENVLIEWWHQNFNVCIEWFHDLAANRQQSNVSLNFMVVVGACNRIADFLHLIVNWSSFLMILFRKNPTKFTLQWNTYKLVQCIHAGTWFLTFPE